MDEMKDVPTKNADILEKIETEDVDLEAPAAASKRKRVVIEDAMHQLGFGFMPMTVLREKARPNSKRTYVVTGYDTNGGLRYILSQANGKISGQKIKKLWKQQVELAMEIVTKGKHSLIRANQAIPPLIKESYGETEGEAPFRGTIKESEMDSSLQEGAEHPKIFGEEGR
jgi:hypothetical protein